MRPQTKGEAVRLDIELDRESSCHWQEEEGERDMLSKKEDEEQKSVIPSEITQW